jgi:hypothetical protein
MRWSRLFGIWAVSAIAFGAVQAHGESLPFSGTLSLTFTFLGVPLSAAPVPGSGVATIAGSPASHLASIGLPASAFDIAGALVSVTDPAAAPIKGLVLTVRNGLGAFSGGPPAGIMPLSGLLKVCAFRVCSNATANVSVPLSVVGVVGAIAVPPGTSTASVNITIRGAPWTAGVAAVGTLTQHGFVHGPASGTSSTAQASGAIRLVTPFYVSTNIGAYAVVPGFAFVDLHFVPEPSTLLLLGGGIAGLVLVGRSKRS